jgi:hypothetical protein
MHAMDDNDAAFLWETEALRTSQRRSETETPSEVGDPIAGQWVTLRDAHYETGIPIETLRKWARRKSVPSSMEQTEFGTRRMIPLEAVIARAHALGRPLTPVPTDRRDLHETEPAAPPAPRPADLQPEPQPTAESEPASGPKPEPTAEAAAPEGTVLVPIAAWDKMLMQLGNLHEAGQQLAEAKERAAKAETEAKFLRERLREMRATPELHSPVDPSPSTGDPATEEDAPPEKMWRYVYRGWSRRRKTRG